MQLAARLLVGEHDGAGDRVARLCLSHTLQLILKWFCLADQLLADSLACCNFIAGNASQSEYAREAVGSSFDFNNSLSTKRVIVSSCFVSGYLFSWDTSFVLCRLAGTLRLTAQSAS
jgi:hypothetical protein